MKQEEPVRGYSVEIKTANLTYELEALKNLLAGWDRQFGCLLQESSNSITLIAGKSCGLQLVLHGRKGRKYASFQSAEVLGQSLDEERLLDFLACICSLQTHPCATIGVILQKEGHHPRPLVIRNGEFYDEGRMMDILWNHYSATRVRESKRMEDIYYFLRDVPQGW
ncbi:hypothetical protein [Effusibacillus lacus]|uniref:hypothetical protein n=1 Tax=Effusibacillus lacus TaxID=1348429 RepID=UPI000BB8B76A|nr:hypothetical protein [Effusibacillus lacus]TCS76917.1 hypothetical protein EDD64_101141 [Effusibacillus lacus]